MRTKKGGARRVDAKLKKNGAVAVAQKKMMLIRTTFAPFLNQNGSKFKLNATYWRITYNLKHKKLNLKWEKDADNEIV